MNELTINRNVIKSNFEIISQKTNAEIIYVAKANCYGLGENVLKALPKEITKIAVAYANEGLKVKEIIPNSEILILLPQIDKCQISLGIEKQYIFSVGDIEYLSRLLKIAKVLNTKLRVSFMINSGMNRFGFNDKNKLSKAYDIALHEKVEVVSDYTHLASSNYNYANLQLEKFNKISINNKKHLSLNDYSINVEYKNIFAYRTGITLLGGDKSNGMTQCFTLKSQIIDIQQLEKGDFLGYDFGYYAKYDTTVAVVGIGYADIAIRGLKGNNYVKINGNKAKIIGNACMDVMFVDITKLFCKIGDDVIITDDDLPIENLAFSAQTISYELMTSLGERVVRKLI